MSGNQDFLLEKMLEIIVVRVRHGYSVIDSYLPKQYSVAIQSYVNTRRQLFSDGNNKNPNIFFDLKALNMFGKEKPQLTRGVLADTISRYSDTVDPQRGRRHRRHPCSSNTLIPMDGRTVLDPAPASTDLRREILRHIATALLEDDPRTLEGVLRALSRPSRARGNNVIFLVTKRPKSSVLNVSLFEAFANNPRLTALAFELADSGIRVLGQLVCMKIDTLVARHNVCESLLYDMDFACGTYGLQLEMTAAEFI
jgi:hypothetical protein